MKRLLLVVVVAACGSDSSPPTCHVDSDCSTGTVCELRDSTSQCIAAADATIVIGQSAPVSGTNQLSGVDVKLGVELAFAQQNAAGGIRGRMLQLDLRDD